ncbi:MAG TPA: hypothetical protein VGR88_08725, partial [Ktedonobacterales bacterium]|nr:hypothetical protein [Ktedonobacterales bacterium]
MARATIGAPIPQGRRAAYQRDVDAARGSLGESEFNRAWAAGSAAPLADVTRAALVMPLSSEPP